MKIVPTRRTDYGGHDHVHHRLRGGLHQPLAADQHGGQRTRCRQAVAQFLSRSFAGNDSVLGSVLYALLHQHGDRAVGGQRIDRESIRVPGQPT